MREWESVLRFVRDNITFIVFLLTAAVFTTGWLLFEAFRSTSRREEVYRLQRRVRELETESWTPRAGAPVVLASRWLKVGAAATSSDGGCLVLLDRISPANSEAAVTVRVDGFAVLQNHWLRAGQSVDVDGKFGTYTVTLHAIGTGQANVGAVLRKPLQVPAPGAGV